ncbi:hypothetical protein JCM11641_006363 [Rhodosporidiobolus odoratus]
MSYPAPSEPYPPGPSAHPTLPTAPLSTSITRSPTASHSVRVGGEHGASAARAKGYQPTRVHEANGVNRRSAKACQYCRKAKSRCDGLENYPCRRCRESGVECVFEGMTVDELERRSARLQQAKQRGDPAGILPTADMSLLELRLEKMEKELDELRTRADKHEDRLDRLDVDAESRETDSRSNPEEGPDDQPKSALNSRGATEALEKEAFNLFWEMYAPLAPHIDPAADTWENLKGRSPLLSHCIIAIASRFNENRGFFGLHRNSALRLLRETLYPERPLTLDDLKGAVIYSAWMGKGAPPGHSVSLALQLDLPKSLERLLASVSGPPTEAAQAFEQHMPAVRTYLTLYAQDLWLSFAMGRRPLVTIDLSVTSARLLLQFASLRPVDGRVIAQSELVTILGVVQESFLKREAAQTIQLVQQGNAHLDTWMQTWKAWADSQDPTTARYILASLSIMLQSGRFYMNSMGLRDITRPEELLPHHLGFLRTALDGAVRIQSIHPAQKIAHSSELTYISLSTSALFLLKMVKLAPHVFSPVHCPSYPSLPLLATTPSNLPYDVAASSPDTSASPLSVSVPSIAQALDAARYSAQLLSHAPAKQRTYSQAIEAALLKLEGELAGTPSAGLVAAPREPGVYTRSGTGKRPRHAVDGDSEQAHRPPPPPPLPASTSQLTPLSSLPSLFPTPSFAQSDTAAPPSVPSQTSDPYLPQQPRLDLPPQSSQGLEYWSPVAPPQGSDPAVAGLGTDGYGGELDELSIASLIGTDSFWSWTSSLPGETIQPFVS